MYNYPISFNKIARGLFLILLFSPILGYFYTETFLLPKTINYSLSFVFFILGFLYIFKKNLKIHSFIVLYFLFAVYKLIWNIDVLSDDNIKILTRIWYYISDFSIVAMLIIIYNVTFTEKFIEISKKIIFITLILAAIVSIIQVFDMSFFNYYNREYLENLDIYTYRRGSIFSYIHISSAGYDFLPLLAITLSVLLMNKNKKFIICFISGGIVAFLSNNRYIMICYVFLYIMLYVYYKKNRLKYSLYVIITVLGFYYFLTNIIGYDLVEWYNERLLAEGSIQETTRYKAISNFIKFFPQHPWFGFGEQTYEIRKASSLVGSSHIHVGYLSHLVNYGIVGCSFLYGAWFLIMRKFYKTAKETNYWGSFFAFCCLLIAFATYSNSSIFFYGFMFAFIFDKYYNDKMISNQNIVN
jgi:hypothetical protein